jgi:hypothetical protein
VHPDSLLVGQSEQFTEPFVDELEAQIVPKDVDAVLDGLDDGFVAVQSPFALEAGRDLPADTTR